jgi:hypothetical protein
MCWDARNHNERNWLHEKWRFGLTNNQAIWCAIFLVVFVFYLVDISWIPNGFGLQFK